MKNVFLDSNIWLSLYHFPKNDLDQFYKLKELNGTAFKILIPEQTYHEVKRNRDTKVKDAMVYFEKFKDYQLSFPSFCKSYSEYQNFSSDFEKLKKDHKEWCKKIKEDIATQSLEADKVIKDLFESCDLIPCTKDIIRAAEIRYKRGNPPGKNNKFGDAINWECLLQNVPDEEDLSFISSDKDYASAIDNKQFNLFLKEEWEVKKKSSIHFYVDLNTFFQVNDIEIKLEIEQKKEDLINSLRYSWSFENTHNIISELDKFSDWTVEQIERMCYAASNNFQVSYILSDKDVFDFYKKILSYTSVNNNVVADMRERIEEIEQEIE